MQKWGAAAEWPWRKLAEGRGVPPAFGVQFAIELRLNFTTG
jgi:hypothetical protein